MPKFDNRTPAAIVAQPPPPTTKKSSRNQMNVAAQKRMSIAYVQHPVMPYVTPQGYQQYASQQQLMIPRHNYQQLMWHARSMESGLGIIKKNALLFN